MISNSTTGIPTEEVKTTCVHVSEATPFLEHKDFNFWVVFRELLGHGTGKLPMENMPESFNFDIQKHLTGQPIDSWYRPG